MHEEDITIPQGPQAITPNQPGVSFAQKQQSFQTPPQGAVVVADRDPIPQGPVGWIMRITHIKRIHHARTVGSIFIGIIVVVAVFIVVREYFISLVMVTIPETVPLVKEIPVIE